MQPSDELISSWQVESLSPQLPLVMWTLIPFGADDNRDLKGIEL